MLIEDDHVQKSIETSINKDSKQKNKLIKIMLVA